MLLTFGVLATGFVQQPSRLSHVAPRSEAVTLCIRPASACWTKEQSNEMLLRFGSAFEDAEEKVHAYENLLLSRSQGALLDAALLEVESASITKFLLLRRKTTEKRP